LNPWYFRPLDVFFLSTTKTVSHGNEFRHGAFLSLHCTVKKVYRVINTGSCLSIDRAFPSQITFTISEAINLPFVDDFFVHNDKNIFSVNHLVVNVKQDLYLRLQTIISLFFKFEVYVVRLFQRFTTPIMIDLSLNTTICLIHSLAKLE